jgi:hypothetical protein
VLTAGDTIECEDMERCVLAIGGTGNGNELSVVSSLGSEGCNAGDTCRGFDMVGLYRFFGSVISFGWFGLQGKEGFLLFIEHLLPPPSNYYSMMMMLKWVAILHTRAIWEYVLEGYYAPSLARRGNNNECSIKPLFILAIAAAPPLAVFDGTPPKDCSR